jgi:hypothetical protein
VSVLDVDGAVQEYLAQPVNFGGETPAQRTAEADAFRAGARWALAQSDWRVVAGFVPGRIAARFLRGGDRVELAGVEGVVVSGQIYGDDAHFTLRTDAGGEIAFARPEETQVRVLVAGQAVPS